MQKTYQINDLETVRLLADPLKLRLLLAFAAGDKTAKQVASELGEPLTKLYRHVDALHDAGLLTIVAERQKRGTVERTFRAVAGRFEVDGSLFAGEPSESTAQAARGVLRGGESEILEALAHGNSTDCPPVVLRLRMRASRARLASLRKKLLEWVDEAEAADDSEAEDSAEAGALISFYMIDDSSR